MASISKSKNGTRTIYFTPANGGPRAKLTLGKVPQKTADRFKSGIEAIIAAAAGGHALDRETTEWLTSIDGALRERMVKLGLVKPRENATLAAFIDDYIAKRTDVKADTLIVWRNARRNLLAFFGAGKPLRDVTPGDADAFRLWLLQQPKSRRTGDAAGTLAENTVNRRCGIAKQFFRAALRSKLIAENPFDGIEESVRGDEDKFFMVDRETSDKILEACPDSQWKLIFALSRFGGLRCPSEHVGLRWADIDWANNRFKVHSPKTERHKGGASRIVPIFPELRPILDAAWIEWQEADDASEFVVTRCRSSAGNLRTSFLRILDRAGIEAWPRLFHNLRASRQTELSATFPIHVVCKWLGNKAAIAQEHYLRVTDDDFERAVAGGATVVQNLVQTAPERPGHARTTHDATVDDAGEFPVMAARDSDCHSVKVVPVRLERTTSRM